MKVRIPAWLPGGTRRQKVYKMGAISSNIIPALDDPAEK
jgi:hypothetical protein